MQNILHKIFTPIQYFGRFRVIMIAEKLKYQLDKKKDREHSKI